MIPVRDQPRNIYVGITDKCNANCIMCWRYSGQPPFLDISQEILEKIRPALEGAEFIGWWGDGEIFSYPDLDNLLEFMESISGVRHSFSTNGKMLSKYAVRLARINISEIIVSIDGATEGTLSRIRVGIHLDDIVNGVTDLYYYFDKNERPRPNIIFSFVSMMSNIYELPMLVELASSLEVPEVYVNPLNPHHSHLVSECLPDVAPGLEKKYFDMAQERADKLGISLIHCNPIVMVVQDA